MITVSIDKTDASETNSLSDRKKEQVRQMEWKWKEK